MFESKLRSDFRGELLAIQITKGILMGIIVVILGISFSVLIFSVSLPSYLAVSIGFVLMGNVIMISLVALLSSFPGFIAIGQDVPAVILSLIVASIIAMMPEYAEPEEKFSTVVVIIIATTLATGVFFAVLGVFRLGNLIRFLPFPVVGGYLAGTGWLLFIGGIRLMAETSTYLELLQPDRWIQWLPGLVFGFVLLFVLGRYRNPVVLPLMFLCGFLLFYSLVWLTRTPVSYIQAQGLLLGPFPEERLWRFPYSVIHLAGVDWYAIIRNVGLVVPILVVSSIALLLNATGMELATMKDVRLNKELVVAGLGNLMGGLLGGIPAYQTLSLSSLNHQLGGSSRVASFITALFCATILFFGATILSIIPKMVIGGFVVYLGLSLLIEWIYKTWFRFPRIEYLVIVSILGVIAIFGFLQGIIAGTILAIILFAVSYGQIDVIKHTLTGSSYRSRVTRNSKHNEFLLQEGESLYILQLQGFIFFGTANKLLERVSERIRRKDPPTVRYLILDFRQVTGLDSTGMLSFTKMKQIVKEHDLVLVLTSLSSTIRKQFIRGEIIDLREEGLQVFENLDEGLEWCEEQILAAMGDGTDEINLPDYLEMLIHDDGLVRDLVSNLRHIQLNDGYYIIRQGDASDNIYFIESGQITAQLELEDGNPLRLETMRGGHVVGEIGFYLDKARTASVITDEPSSIYFFTAEDLKSLEKDNPRAAIAFHRIIASMLAERVIHLTNTVEALNR